MHVHTLYIQLYSALPRFVSWPPVSLSEQDRNVEQLHSTDQHPGEHHDRSFNSLVRTVQFSSYLTIQTPCNHPLCPALLQEAMRFRVRFWTKVKIRGGSGHQQEPSS